MLSSGSDLGSRAHCTLSEAHVFFTGHLSGPTGAPVHVLHARLASKPEANVWLYQGRIMPDGPLLMCDDFFDLNAMFIGIIRPGRTSRAAQKRESGDSIMRSGPTTGP